MNRLSFLFSYGEHESPECNDVMIVQLDTVPSNGQPVLGLNASGSLKQGSKFFCGLLSLFVSSVLLGFFEPHEITVNAPN